MTLRLRYQRSGKANPLCRDNPEFCVNSFMMQIEYDLFEAVAGLSSYRLANNITPVGMDVKDGGAVQPALDILNRRC